MGENFVWKRKEEGNASFDDNFAHSEPRNTRINTGLKLWPIVYGKLQPYTPADLYDRRPVKGVKE